jgi:Zn-dependent protease
VIAAANFDVTAAVILFIVLLISNTVHEAAHALFAKLGGDLTAYKGGQVSLNPLPHIRREPFGMVLLPLITIVSSGGTMCLGYASAPIDPVWAFHHPKRAALVSAAGPLSNLVLAAIAFSVLQYVGRPESSEGDAVRRIAGVFLMLNLLLAVLNLFPLPPLDGSGVLGGLVKPVRVLYDNLARLPMFPIAVLVLVMYVMPTVINPIWNVVNGWLDYRLPYHFG